MTLSRALFSGHRPTKSDELDKAFTADASAEAEHRGIGDVEMVLVAADSLDTICHTHSSYFREEGDRMTFALEELLARS